MPRRVFTRARRLSRAHQPGDGRRPRRVRVRPAIPRPPATAGRMYSPASLVTDDVVMATVSEPASVRSSRSTPGSRRSESRVGCRNVANHVPPGTSGTRKVPVESATADRLAAGISACIRRISAPGISRIVRLANTMPTTDTLIGACAYVRVAASSSSNDENAQQPTARLKFMTPRRYLWMPYSCAPIS